MVRRVRVLPKWRGWCVGHIPEPGVVAVRWPRGHDGAILRVSATRSECECVWDQTGLNGKYYFAFRYADESGPDRTQSIFDFLGHPDGAGLKLEKRRGPVEMLVVDHVEKMPLGELRLSEIGAKGFRFRSA